MVELDKGGMGKRIREIRISAGMRQWELARLLGTTQSAVHKYEHGVVPEPRRLVEMARIGSTSVEWILTGSHWENGSSERERVSPELLDTAALLRRLGEEERERLEEALRIVRDAVRALEASEGADVGTTRASLADAFREHGRSTVRLLESAWRIQRSVLQRVAEEAERRIGRPAEARGDGGVPPASTPR
jgi:transcriptional regulator with XRE-family HTH domain